jgi:predicted ester cyclase
MSDDAAVSSDGQQGKSPEVGERQTGDKGFLACFPGCGCVGTAPTPTRAERIRRMIEEGTDDSPLFSPDFVNRTPWDLATRRHTNDEKAAFRADRVFSDMQMIVEEATEDGDTVVIRWRLRGKWTGPLPFAPGIPPTGRLVEFTGTYFYRFVGDMVVEKDGEFDVKAASKALLAGVNITCGSDDCVDVVQSLSRRPASGGESA